MLAKKTSKNQITLPKKIVDRFRGTDYFDVTVGEGGIVLRPVSLDSLEKVRDKLAKAGVTPADVRAAVTWARRSSRRR